MRLSSDYAHRETNAAAAVHVSTFIIVNGTETEKKGKERKGGAERIFCDAFKMFFFSSSSFFSSDVKLFGFVVTQLCVLRR